MIHIANGMACGFWMRLSASGMVIMRATNDAQMSMDEIRITPRQFAAMNRVERWMAGPDWVEVPTQYQRNTADYWRAVMLAWGMEPTKTYETFDGMLPVAFAKRLGLIKSARATIC